VRAGGFALSGQATFRPADRRRYKQRPFQVVIRGSTQTVMIGPIIKRAAPARPRSIKIGRRTGRAGAAAYQFWTMA
jgi:hypothetical protein